MSQQASHGTTQQNGQHGDKSAGQLMKEVTEDLSTLFRKEIELAKQEVGKAIGDKVKGAVIIAIAGSLAFFALIFMLLAIRDAFDNILATWLADIVTAGILLVIGALGALVAKNKLTSPISADMTKQTIKDDVKMVKSLGRS